MAIPPPRISRAAAASAATRGRHQPVPAAGIDTGAGWWTRFGAASGEAPERAPLSLGQRGHAVADLPALGLGRDQVEDVCRPRLTLVALERRLCDPLSRSSKLVDRAVADDGQEPAPQAAAPRIVGVRIAP